MFPLMDKTNRTRKRIYTHIRIERKNRMNFWLSIAQAIGRQSVQPLLERGGGFASAKAQEGETT